MGAVMSGPSGLEWVGHVDNNQLEKIIKLNYRGFVKSQEKNYGEGTKAWAGQA